MFIVVRVGDDREEIVWITPSLEEAKKRAENDMHYPNDTYKIVWKLVNDEIEESIIRTLGSSLEQYPTRRWEEVDGVRQLVNIIDGPKDPVKNFAYALLNGDPDALDVLNDVLAMGGIDYKRK